VTGSQKHRDPKYFPYTFTEHGAVMAAAILRSDRAIQMSVFVVRAFIRMRQMLVEQRGLARKLAQLIPHKKFFGGSLPYDGQCPVRVIKK
jgi:hypothetical protein